MHKRIAYNNHYGNYYIKENFIINDYPFIPYYNFETVCKQQPITFPPQHQSVQAGIENQMNPLPIFDNQNDVPSGKLQRKVAIISGGDSGIGRAVAVLFAKEGCDIVFVYFNKNLSN